MISLCVLIIFGTSDDEKAGIILPHSTGATSQLLPCHGTAVIRYVSLAEATVMT